MTGLEPIFEYTQQEIDEYHAKCFSNFWGVGGNIPFPKFKKEYGMEVGSIPISVNERYYLAKQPYAICRKPIIANHYYSSPQIPLSENKQNLITGINLVSLSTRDTIPLDIRHLLKTNIDINGKRHFPNGTVNLYISQLISNAIPYITLREVLQGLVEYIGNKHIFFTKDTFNGFRDPRLSYIPKSAVFHCNFAEYVSHNNH